MQKTVKRIVFNPGTKYQRAYQFPKPITFDYSDQDTDRDNYNKVVEEITKQWIADNDLKQKTTEELYMLLRRIKEELCLRAEGGNDV